MAQVGDIGLVITVTIKTRAADGSLSATDISAATTKNIILETPSGTATAYTASFSTDGSDGILTYSTADATILSEAGVWKIQGKYITNTQTIRTKVERFLVEANLA